MGSLLRSSWALHSGPEPSASSSGLASSLGLCSCLRPTGCLQAARLTRAWGVPLAAGLPPPSHLQRVEPSMVPACPRCRWVSWPPRFPAPGFSSPFRGPAGVSGAPRPAAWVAHCVLRQVRAALDPSWASRLFDHGPRGSSPANTRGPGSGFRRVLGCLHPSSGAKPPPACATPACAREGGAWSCRGQDSNLRPWPLPRPRSKGAGSSPRLPGSCSALGPGLRP